MESETKKVEADGLVPVKVPGFGEELLHQLPKVADPERLKWATEGSWSLRHVEGSREGVKKAINDDSRVPQEWRWLLCARIDGAPAEFNHVRVDAHGHGQPGDESAVIHLKWKTVL